MPVGMEILTNFVPWLVMDVTFGQSEISAATTPHPYTTRASKKNKLAKSRVYRTCMHVLSATAMNAMYTIYILIYMAVPSR